MFVYEPKEPAGVEESKPLVIKERRELRLPPRPAAVGEAFAKIEKPVFKLVDMKLPPAPKVKEDTAEGPIAKREQYPYGLQLRFEQEQVEKIPKLKNFRVGDSVIIHGKAEVTEIRMREEVGGKEFWTIEIQLKKVDVTKGG